MKLELSHLYDDELLLDEFDLVNENDYIIGIIYDKQDAEEIVKRVNKHKEVIEMYNNLYKDYLEIWAERNKLKALNRELIQVLEESNRLLSFIFEDYFALKKDINKDKLLEAIEENGFNVIEVLEKARAVNNQ